MELFDMEEMTDGELSQMLTAWVVTVPSRELRTRIFGERGTVVWEVEQVQLPWLQQLEGRQSRSIGVAFLMQAGAVALVFLMFGSPVMRTKIRSGSYFALLTPYRSRVARRWWWRSARGDAGGERCSSEIFREAVRSSGGRGSEAAAAGDAYHYRGRSAD